MQFIGRKKEVQRLRALVAGTDPSLTLVAGVPGVGKTAFLRHALTDIDAFWFQAVPLPDPDQRLLLAERIRRHLRAQAMTDGEIDALLGVEPDWPALLQSLVRPFFRTLRSTVVVLEGWDRLVEGRRR
ncbi:MAG: ATP-binding protein, partial [Gemmatimonadota bacterium]